MVIASTYFPLCSSFCESRAHAIQSKTPKYDIPGALDVTVHGVEKHFCVHGGWMTIAHVAHLIGNCSILIDNASNALQCLLRRHSRMCTRIRIDNDRYFIDTIEYNREYLSSDLFFSISEISNESWQEIVERQCNQDPYSNNGTIIFPTFYFMLVFDSR